MLPLPNAEPQLYNLSFRFAVVSHFFAINPEQHMCCGLPTYLNICLGLSAVV